MALKPTPASGQVEAQVMQNLGEDVLNEGSDPTQGTVAEQPLYQIFEGSKIPVSKAVGPSWRTKYQAACAAYSKVWEAWEEVLRYYNHNQVKENITPRGHFTRGDVTENLVYSNINTVLPAIYSRNPDFSCTTSTAEMDPFCKTMQVLLNALIRRKAAPGINLKPKAKRQAMMAELTNAGYLKLDYKLKDGSREQALEEATTLLQELEKAKDRNEINDIYGKLMALEEQMETRQPSGFILTNPLPHNIIIDPYAESDDGLDANWWIEETFLPTEYLNQRFAKGGKGDRSEDRVLVYKPTHKAAFKAEEGERDDNVGLVMQAMKEEPTRPTSYTDEERLSYLYTYMTEVVYIWDKTTRRLLLFDKNDWTWPIWVWDDWLHLSRFFPYFLLQFSLNTGGTASPGVTSYYLDQQDAINDINRQMALLRRRAFDFYFYNLKAVTKDEAEKMSDAMAGRTQTNKRAIGVKLEPNQKLSDVFGPVGLPDKDVAPFFDKGDLYSSIDRLSATSDALRGVQFKANTTEDAVQAYMDAVRVRIGAKTDSIEDCLADVGLAMAEVCIQFMAPEDVAAIIGKTLATNWKQMSVEEFNATYNLQIVAGSIEKPTSVFKKKEAIQIAQAIGQFANAAPASTVIIALKVLEKAFTEVVILPEDWAMLRQEVQAVLQGQGAGGEPMGGGASGAGIDKQALMNAPPEVKQKAMQMKQQGASDEEIVKFLQQSTGGGAGPPKQGVNGNGEAPQQQR